MTITYEIKELKGRVVSQERKIDGFDFGRCDGLDAIRYVVSGKTRSSWLRIPNDFQMAEYYESFKAVIKDDNGKEIYKLVKNHN